MTTYAEKLKHPKWQKIRLRILQRADFECEDCGSAEKSLHIHHGYYERGREPWDYPEESLHCLCEDCHAKADQHRSEFMLASRFLDPGDWYYLLGIVRAIISERRNEPIDWDLDMGYYQAVLDYLGVSEAQFSRMKLWRRKDLRASDLRDIGMGRRP
jgi:hypothetical protein